MLVTHFLRALAFGLLLAGVIPHSACSRTTETKQRPSPTQMSGAYVNETGVLEFRFSGERVRMTGGIADFDNSYAVEGDTLWITAANGGRKAMTIRDDGSLAGQLGVFAKKK